MCTAEGSPVKYEAWTGIVHCPGAIAASYTVDEWAKASIFGEVPSPYP
jgi:hypothetical protein